MQNENLREKLLRALESYNVTEDMLDQFIFLLSPLIQTHVQALIEANLSEELLEALMMEAAKNDATEEEAVITVLQAYEGETGKSIDQEVDDYISMIIDGLVKTSEEMKSRIEYFKTLTPEQRIEEMSKDINSVLNVNNQ